MGVDFGVGAETHQSSLLLAQWTPAASGIVSALPVPDSDERLPLKIIINVNFSNLHTHSSAQDKKGARHNHTREYIYMREEKGAHDRHTDTMPHRDTSIKGTSENELGLLFKSIIGEIMLLFYFRLV